MSNPIVQSVEAEASKVKSAVVSDITRGTSFVKDQEAVLIAKTWSTKALLISAGVGFLLGVIVTVIL